MRDVHLKQRPGHTKDYDTTRVETRVNEAGDLQLDEDGESGLRCEAVDHGGGREDETCQHLREGGGGG